MKPRQRTARAAAPVAAAAAPSPSPPGAVGTRALLVEVVVRHSLSHHYLIMSILVVFIHLQVPPILHIPLASVADPNPAGSEPFCRIRSNRPDPTKKCQKMKPKSNK